METNNVTEAEPLTGLPAVPSAHKSPVTSALHGEERVDDYFWLREKAKPEVAAYLEAENAYTDAVMRPTEPLQERSTRRCWRGSRRPTSPCPTRRGGTGY